MNNESAVMQFARVARKSGKQLIVAVREQDMKKMEAESGRIIKISSHQNIVADAFALLSCPTPGTGKSKFSPSPAFLNKNREMVAQGESRNHLYPDFIS